MSSESSPVLDEPPVEDHEWLLRHFPSDPSEYEFAKKFIRYSVFIPRKSDDKGLSMSREGAAFVTAERLLATARNLNVKQYGGVVAVLTEAIRSLNLTIEITPGDTPGHIIIRQINRDDWDLKATDGTYPKQQAIRELADTIVRFLKTQLQIRIHPTPRPAKK